MSSQGVCPLRVTQTEPDYQAANAPWQGAHHPLAVEQALAHATPSACRLADFTPLTDYDRELVFGTFSAADACNFGVHVYPEEGDRLIVSIVVDAGSHGTHVAGITAAHHEDNPAMNGIAPGELGGQEHCQPAGCVHRATAGCNSATKHQCF